MSENRFTLPNVITVVRIIVAPAVAYMALAPDMSTRVWAFVLFVAAALSDVYDGYLARRYDLITDMGKLLDPLADKLLMAAAFVPFYIISHRGVEGDLIPWLGPMPIWVLVVIFGREVFITIFRSYAAARGVIIPAGKSGKQRHCCRHFSWADCSCGTPSGWPPRRMLGMDRFGLSGSNSIRDGSA